MSRERKFIIVKDKFGKNTKIRIGWPIYHRDLLDKSDENEGIDCYGGGRWNLDYDNKTITLYGSSDDFGKPNKKDIETAIKNLDDHAYWQLEWMMERIFDKEFPDRDYSDLKDYKFIVDYD